MSHLLPSVNTCDGLPEHLIGLFKTIPNLCFGIKSLNDAQTAQCLFYLAHQCAPLLLGFQ